MKNASSKIIFFYLHLKVKGPLLRPRVQSSLVMQHANPPALCRMSGCTSKAHRNVKKNVQMQPLRSQGTFNPHEHYMLRNEITDFFPPHHCYQKQHVYKEDVSSRVIFIFAYKKQQQISIMSCMMCVFRLPLLPTDEKKGVKMEWRHYSCTIPSIKPPSLSASWCCVTLEWLTVDASTTPENHW